ncbi:MAG: hypothetical protein ACJA09_001316 [Alcanivorax sp.]|jgi:hypothetical protein
MELRSIVLIVLLSIVEATLPGVDAKSDNGIAGNVTASLGVRTSLAFMSLIDNPPANTITALTRIFS